jgi:hypothetical protein
MYAGILVPPPLMSMRFIFLLACISAAFGHITRAQAPPKAPWGLDPHDTTSISVPEDIRRAAAGDLDYEDAEPLKGVAVDLNGDGIEDYLLQSAPRLCGNGGCVYVLCDGATRSKLGQFFGSPLYVRADRAHGYPNIATYSRQSVDSGVYTQYSFDGRAYVVTSRRLFKGAAVDRLFEMLRRVPMWRPRP